jgi:prevent-host-death family protein
MQKEATAMTVRNNLGALLNEVQYRHDSIIITKAGTPVAAMVDMATYERMQRKDSGEFERLWAEMAKGFEDLSDSEVEELVNTEVQAARADIHARRLAAVGSP